MKDEALRLALEALEGVLDDSPKVLDASISGGLYEVVQCRDAITAIKAALEAKDEPVAYIYEFWADRGHKGLSFEKERSADNTPLYTTPPPVAEPHKRTWVGLTDDEIVLIVAECAASHQHTDIHFARAIEAKLKEKNT